MHRPAAIGEAAAVFHALVTAHGLQVEELTARSAWQVFADYGRVAFETPNLPGADGLLYQYGMHRFMRRSLFELDLVRQFELVDAQGDHDHYVQMHCTLRYTPTPELKALGADHCWWFPDQDVLAVWLRSVASRPEWAVLKGAEAEAGRGSPGGRLRTSLLQAAAGTLVAPSGPHNDILPGRLRQLANEARVPLDEPHPLPELVPPLRGGKHDRTHRPCHSQHDATDLSRSATDTPDRRPRHPLLQVYGSTNGKDGVVSSISGGGSTRNQQVRPGSTGLSHAWGLPAAAVLGR